jgi:hypothetical protein
MPPGHELRTFTRRPAVRPCSELGLFVVAYLLYDARRILAGDLPIGTRTLSKSSTPHVQRWAATRASEKSGATSSWLMVRTKWSDLATAADRTRDSYGNRPTRQRRVRSAALPPHTVAPLARGRLLVRA